MNPFMGKGIADCQAERQQLRLSYLQFIKLRRRRCIVLIMRGF